MQNLFFFVIALLHPHKRGIFPAALSQKLEGDEKIGDSGISDRETQSFAAGRPGRFSLAEAARCGEVYKME